jgi:hypothetical protein
MTGPSADRDAAGVTDLRIDHLVYAAVDLDAAVDDVASLLGVRPAAGGRHVGVGTRNFLLSLAPDGERGPYLELIGPDPTQTMPAGTPLPFGIDRLGQAGLVGFALGTGELDAVVGRARADGYDPGEPQGMQRATPDGGLLSWRLTRGTAPAGRGGGLVPFLIDWLESPHPSTTTPRGATLVALRAEHPDPAAVLATHRALGWSMEVRRGPAPALTATIDGPNGSVELR